MNRTARSQQEHTRRRTLAQAMRAPQWHRLIVTIHKAQEAAGYDGRQFGPDEMRFFGASLIGMPWEMPRGARVYWVERTSLVHSDQTTSVRYALKVWDAETPAKVDTIADETIPEFDPSAEVDEGFALDYIRRAAHQVGARL